MSILHRRKFINDRNAEPAPHPHAEAAAAKPAGKKSKGARSRRGK